MCWCERRPIVRGLEDLKRPVAGGLEDQRDQLLAVLGNLRRLVGGLRAKGDQLLEVS